MEHRKEFYILAKSGEMVFNIQAGKSTDEQDNSRLLTASYLTGVLQFAQAVSNDIISNFEMGKLDIFLKIGHDFPLYYVYIIGKKVKLKRKNIERNLNKIIMEFEKQYSLEDITGWDGNLNAFEEFIPKAKKILSF